MELFKPKGALQPVVQPTTRSKMVRLLTRPVFLKWVDLPTLLKQGQKTK
jgi:hypothetical protein